MFLVFVEPLFFFYDQKITIIFVKNAVNSIYGFTQIFNVYFTLLMYNKVFKKFENTRICFI